jgi:hypothetical protein
MFTPETITPQQRLRGAYLSGVRQIKRARIPVYGLPMSWNGVRSTGNTCFETGVTRDADGVTAELHESVELVHRSGESVLRIDSSDHVRSISDDELLELLDRTGTCGPMTITVDGRPIAFACARSTDRFVGRWAGYRATVTVIGEGWPIATGLDIVRISDFAPYHEGRLRMLEERSGYNLRG